MFWPIRARADYIMIYNGDVRQCHIQWTIDYTYNIFPEGYDLPDGRCGLSYTGANVMRLQPGYHNIRELKHMPSSLE